MRKNLLELIYHLQKAEKKNQQSKNKKSSICGTECKSILIKFKPISQTHVMYFYNRLEGSTKKEKKIVLLLDYYIFLVWIYQTKD